MKITETEMRGLITGKAMPADIFVGESLAAYLIRKFTNLHTERDALAAENAVMLRLLTDISENHVEYFSEGEGYTFAGVPLDYVSEINTYVSRDVNAENPFPATDAYLNSVRAEGVEMFSKELGSPYGDGEGRDYETGFNRAIEVSKSKAVKFVSQLRAGKDGE
ncbi:MULTISPECIES: hypothetical protein [Pantoea]|uniref:hypothetical protein n=1 Tax=Pantoea TaxID=53335 RepID=UPI002579E3D2|nr:MULTISPECIES: hypothetical protein [Pantoea]